mmetsp:Transcript_32649/g.68962  ORF Transcript_32649/g.68962 Transcript_32649/m.68962 type:complete len:227 (+) Transcript_32649:705-1385(+)
MAPQHRVLLNISLHPPHTAQIAVFFMEVQLRLLPAEFGREASDTKLRCDLRCLERYTARCHVFRQSHGHVGCHGLKERRWDFVSRFFGRAGVVSRCCFGIGIGSQQPKRVVVVVGLEEMDTRNGVSASGIVECHHDQHVQSGFERHEWSCGTGSVRSCRWRSFQYCRWEPSIDRKCVVSRPSDLRFVHLPKYCTSKNTTTSTQNNDSRGRPKYHATVRRARSIRRV